MPSIRWDTTLEATVAAGSSSLGKYVFWIRFWLPTRLPMDSMTLAWKKLKGNMAARSMRA